MHTTYGRYSKPTFEPRAEFVAARDIIWGDCRGGHVKIPANAPIEFDKLDPPCGLDHAAKLYRTGFVAMVLDDDGNPKLKSAPALAQTPTPQPAAPTKPQEPLAPGLHVKSHGFGRYSVVDQDGNRIAPADGWLKKTEAEALVNAG